MGSNALDILNEANHDLVLATEVAGVLVPVVKGVVTDVKQMMDVNTITYTMAIKTGMQNLDDADAAFSDVINKVNAERAKAGLTPLQMPSTS
ncbi:MAG TPA: hypothetical protein VMJ66_02185 [Geobacteraceae bacterium]|nr:hypothetical protein [Geobacteraceae bacterium]